jgi:hypothetical protein
VQINDIGISHAHTASKSDGNESEKIAKNKVIRLSIWQMTFLFSFEMRYFIVQTNHSIS